MNWLSAARHPITRDPKNTLLEIEFYAIRSEFCEGLLKIGNEVVSLLQKSINGETSFVEARDEVAECGEAPYNSLYPLHVLN